MSGRLGERLRRRMHLVRLRTSAKNRIFGLQTQWGVPVSLGRLRKADGLALLERAGLPEVWRRSISECLAVVDFLDARIEPLDAELKPFAQADPRAVLLDTIPGVGELLALTRSRWARSAASPGRRSSSPMAGLPRACASRVRVDRAAARSRSQARVCSALAAVEAAQQGLARIEPLAPALPRRRPAAPPNHNSAKAAVARKILIAAWQMLLPK
jgi:hypothetical protein